MVSEYGEPDVLRLVDVPEPHAGPGQLRMRVHATTVNPSDIMLRVGSVASMDGRHVGSRFSPGSEAAGVVDEIGPGTETDLRVGDRVMAFVIPFMPSGGAYAQYLVLDPRQVTAAPAGSSHAEAVTIPLNGMTAQQAIDLLSMAEGDWLAVTGSAGSVGGYTVQLAKAAGLRVVADAAPADEELVRSLGADRVVARGPGVAERVREAVPGGVPGLVDCALLGREILPAIRAGGQVVMGQRAGLPGAPELGDPGDITVHAVYVMDWIYEHDKLDSLRAHAEKGELTMRVAAEYPAAEAAAAHRRFEAGGVRGRLVLTF
ncbi:NADP-dependent oxidoreductase [Streptomyces phaeochromogenes]|uniref:NADP-dependent oxidoreductase n=1 Tax=Streptomyces phaeochromogenes TaxID=1923 RepID=UPI002DD9A427|nr:NADP-dependent oxidoreductase [Streptomyces phaeochromogenes]